MWPSAAVSPWPRASCSGRVVRFGNLAGRLVLIVGNRAVDVELASSGRFGPLPHAVYERWGAFAEWAASFRPEPDQLVVFDKTALGSPSPTPAQVFAVGLNYAEHVREAGLPMATGFPPVFTKFPSSITGPYTQVTLPQGHVDGEVELALIVGRRARNVSVDEGWGHVAAVTVAQDISERVEQFRGSQPQYSLAKSHPGFTPLGPWGVTPDEFADPDALALRSVLNGEVMQDGNTRDLVTGVPELVSGLSRVVTLLPGDVILTGTPDGVGMSRNPPRYLRPGDLLVSTIQDVGALAQTFVSAAD